MGGLCSCEDQQEEEVLFADVVPKKFPVQAQNYCYPPSGKTGANNPVYAMSGQAIVRHVPVHVLSQRYSPSAVCTGMGGKGKGGKGGGMRNQMYANPMGGMGGAGNNPTMGMGGTGKGGMMRQGQTAGVMMGCKQGMGGMPSMPMPMNPQIQMMVMGPGQQLAASAPWHPHACCKTPRSSSTTTPNSPEENEVGSMGETLDPPPVANGHTEQVHATQAEWPSEFVPNQAVQTSFEQPVINAINANGHDAPPIEAAVPEPDAVLLHSVQAAATMPDEPVEAAFPSQPLQAATTMPDEPVEAAFPSQPLQAGATMPDEPVEAAFPSQPLQAATTMPFEPVEAAFPSQPLQDQREGILTAAEQHLPEILAKQDQATTALSEAETKMNGATEVHQSKVEVPNSIEVEGKEASKVLKEAQEHEEELARDKAATALKEREEKLARDTLATLSEKYKLEKDEYWSDWQSHSEWDDDPTFSLSQEWVLAKYNSAVDVLLLEDINSAEDFVLRTAFLSMGIALPSYMELGAMADVQGTSDSGHSETPSTRSASRAEGEAAATTLPAEHL